MSQFQGVRGQMVRDPLYAADGLITLGGTSQLILPRMKSRTYLLLQNQSNAAMYFEIGGARATVAISGGLLTTFTITNGGFGYTQPPTVHLYGGGQVNGNAGSTVGAGQPTWDAPSNIGKATAVIDGSGIVTSITLNHPGSGYIRAPYVFLEHTDADARGAANPFFGSAPTGIMLNSGDPPFVFSAMCPTGPVAVYCPDTNAPFACRYMY